MIRQRRFIALVTLVRTLKTKGGVGAAPPTRGSTPAPHSHTSGIKKWVSAVSTGVIGLMLGTCVLSPLALADAGDPNGVDNRAEPGWGLWFPRSQIAGASFDSGFSNMELGGFLDFEQTCGSLSGLSSDQIDYWFRVSTSVYRMGTGMVEFGCWKDGKFLNTYSSQAMFTGASNVDCLTVRPNSSNGLNIRAEPSTRSRIVGTIRSGSRVRTSGSPASIVEAEGRNWVNIRSPIAGWVSDDRPDSDGNLVLCDR
ncbi:MAG TPA: SH3 domain-containing protein [Crinalium sp.]